MKLREIFKWSQWELKKRLRGHLRKCGYNPISSDGFLYAEGELPVLLVAHLDTVHKEAVRDIIYSKKGRRISSPQGIGGDDRCGVFMILKIIKELNCHVLFCEDEEIGGIGARKFVSSGIVPNVNFIIELDRRGSNDAVFYDCDNKDFTDFIVSFGFKEEWGTFSDISTIAPALGVAAVNISAGYFHEHTLSEYVDIEVARKNAERVKSIVRAADTRYEYIEGDFGFGRYSGYYGCNWGAASYDKYYDYYYEDYYPLPKNSKGLKRQKSISIITANKIEDLMGYAITEDGAFWEDDLYIGYDDYIYIEYDDGMFCRLDGAKAFNAAGGHLRFREECPVFDIFVSREVCW